MKALRFLLVLLCIICIATAVAEEATWEAEVRYTSAGNSKASAGTLIPTEDFSKVIHLKNQVGGWVRIVAPCDGDLSITVLCSDIDRESFQLSIHSDSRTDAVWPRFYRSDTPQTYVFPDVKAGEGVYWWSHKYSGMTYTDDFLMVICFTDHHAPVSTSEPSIIQATCTEPGYEVSACLYCSGNKTETAPALGHNWGPEGIITSAQCTAAGEYGVACLRCGETQVYYKLPALGHEAGAPIVHRAPTCSKIGEDQIRCTRCNELLYTLATATLPHTASHTSVQFDRWFNVYSKSTYCQCGYLIAVEDIGTCPHDNAELSGSLNKTLSVVDTYYCSDCSSSFETIRPSSTSLVNIILTGVCLLLGLAVLVMLTVTLLQAFLPLHKPAKKNASIRQDANVTESTLSSMPTEGSDN